MMNVEGVTNTIYLPDEMHYGDTHTFKWCPQTGKFQISLQQKKEICQMEESVYILTQEFSVKILIELIK